MAEHDDTDMTAAEFLATRKHGQPVTIFHAEPTVVAGTWTATQVVGCTITGSR